MYSSRAHTIESMYLRPFTENSTNCLIFRQNVYLTPRWWSPHSMDKSVGGLSSPHRVSLLLLHSKHLMASPICRERGGRGSKEKCEIMFRFMFQNNIGDWSGNLSPWNGADCCTFIICSVAASWIYLYFFFLMRHAILRAPTIPTQHVVRSLSAWTIYLRGHMYISYLTIGVT